MSNGGKHDPSFMSRAFIGGALGGAAGAAAAAAMVFYLCGCPCRSTEAGASNKKPEVTQGVPAERKPSSQ
jgi:hypothetical protein